MRRSNLFATNCETVPLRSVYDTIPPKVKSELAYLPDQMILDFLLRKARQSTAVVRSGRPAFSAGSVSLGCWLYWWWWWGGGLP